MRHEHDKARQYSDTMECATCGKQWDVNDPDPPSCIDVRAFVVKRPVYRPKRKTKPRMNMIFHK